MNSNRLLSKKRVCFFHKFLTAVPLLFIVHIRCLMDHINCCELAVGPNVVYMFFNKYLVRTCNVPNIY